MTLQITPLNSPSNLLQLPTLPLYLTTISNHSTASSFTIPGINSGSPGPSTKFDLLKKNSCSLVYIKSNFSLWRNSSHSASNRTYTPHRLLPLSQAPRSSRLSILLPSRTICRRLLFMPYPHKCPQFSLCLFYPHYRTFQQSKSHHKVPQLPPFNLFLHPHLNPVQLSEPITLSAVARLNFNFVQFWTWTETRENIAVGGIRARWELAVSSLNYYTRIMCSMYSLTLLSQARTL